jgi:hypothetical protein
MFTRRDLEDYASDGRRGYNLVDVIFAGIECALRKNPTFDAISPFDLEVLLADARRNAEILLVRELRGRTRLDDLGSDDR